MSRVARSSSTAPPASVRRCSQVSATHTLALRSLPDGDEHKGHAEGHQRRAGVEPPAEAVRALTLDEGAEALEEVGLHPQRRHGADG